MKNMKSLQWLVCLLSALIMAPPSPAAEAPAMTVGRIFYIEGDLLRYVPEEKDWVAVVRDAPFGAEDTLFSGSNGMAELIVPNGVWIRMGNSTQIQFIRLDADLAEMDVASGMARFYNKGRAAVKVTSPFGYVLVDPGTIFDLYVGENSCEVVAIKGTVSFVHPATNGRYNAAAGATSILANPQQVSLGNGTVDPDWNRWNMDRENFWLTKGEVKGPSAEYLPPSLRNEAYTFEENGRWESVPYEGEERWFWRPTAVAVDWSPFTVGRWTDWYGDQTWIPAEPFGYITHHYGNWIYARNHWYWAPPAVGIRIGLPLLDIGFFWNPGRVAWIHSGIHIGWVPLAPKETYYSHRPWGGPHTIVVNNMNIDRININLRGHAYVDHAVIVNQSNFYGRNDYRNVRVTNINRTNIINQYRAAPIVDNEVIKNYSATRQRYNFTNAPVQEKPHNSVLDRIRENEKIIHAGKMENSSLLHERLRGVPEGRINHEAHIEQPRGADHIVPAKEVNRPKAEMQFPQREIKGGSRGVPSIEPDRSPRPAERAIPARPSQPGQATPKPERVIPGKPTPPAYSPRPAERAIPARPSQPEQATPKTERVIPGQPTPPAYSPRPAERAIPARPSQPGQATPKPERVIPGQPTPPAQPSRPAERTIPVRPSQPEQATPKTERVIPGQPTPPAYSPRPAERAIPARPSQPGQATPKPERVIPGQPTPPAQPSRPAERTIPVRPSQPEQATPKTERVIPGQPTPPAYSPRPTERAIPARPPQPEQATPKTERVIPWQPDPPAQPSRPAERAIPARPSPPEQAAPRPERVVPQAQPVAPEQVKPENTASRPEPREQKPGRREQPGK